MGSVHSTSLRLIAVMKREEQLSKCKVFNKRGLAKILVVPELTSSLSEITKTLAVSEREGSLRNIS